MEEETSTNRTLSAQLLRTNGAAPESPRPTALTLLLNRATGGRRGPSMLVRETAALHLEERRADWGYSKPVVALDIAWNVVFTLVSVIMLATTLDERPNTPLRLWITGYALQCVVHVVLVWLEYRRRNSRRRRSLEEGSGASRSSDSEGIDSDDEEGDSAGGHRSNIAKRCESVNTMASFLWWIFGFYWVVSGGETLLQLAPRLYWWGHGPHLCAITCMSVWCPKCRLSVVFLAFDVFFAIFCVALACVIGIALCCCLPCIIAILYAVAGQEGASDADISLLSRYRFNQTCGDVEKATNGGGVMVSVGSSGHTSNERVLLSEDAECCICLTSYEDGADLNELPCGHHFHSSCISRWLRINATCPLCKYNILKGNEQV